jgi:hypothetical protein
MRHALLAAAALLAFSGSAFAECPNSSCITFKVPNGDAKYLVSQNLEVGDVPGHIWRLFHTTGIPANAEIGGVKIVLLSNTGEGEMYGPEGHASGFTVFTAENGDKLYARSDILGEKVNGKTVVTWIGHITGGTGKLANIKGRVRMVSTPDIVPTTGGQITNTTWEIELSK